MASTQAEHLVKMANQIAINMAAWGNEEEVAEKIADHLGKFWTPAMCVQLRECMSAEERAPVSLRKALDILSQRTLS